MASQCDLLLLNYVCDGAPSNSCMIANIAKLTPENVLVFSLASAIVLFCWHSKFLKAGLVIRSGH